MTAEGTDPGLGASTPPFLGRAATEFDLREEVHLGISSRQEVLAPVLAAREPKSEPVAALPNGNEATTAPLPSSWLSTTKSRREIPKAAKVGGVGVALLLLMVFTLPQTCSGAAPSRSTSMAAENEVEGAEFLKKRRHLTDEDFRIAGSAAMPTASGPTPVGPSVDIEERQRLRENNPEDLRGAQKAAAGRPTRTRHETRRVRSEEPPESKSLLVFFNEDEETEKHSEHDRKAAQAPRLLPAASTVAIHLTQDIVIRRGRTTVIAIVDKGQLLPAGSKLIGKAAADRDGTATIRFDTIVFPDGGSLRAHAEALDVATGSQTLVGSVTGGAVAEDRSVAESVGSATAERAAFGALGGGLLSGAARQTISENSRQRDSSVASATVVTIARDLELEALFLREVRRGGGR